MMVGVNRGAQSETWKRVPTNSVGAEIGVWMGHTSQHFLKSKPRHLHLVDPWNKDWTDSLNEDDLAVVLKKYKKVVGSDRLEDWDKFYDGVHENIVSEYGSLENVTVHRQKSLDWMQSYTGEKLDWIYIDGDHSYEGCLADFEACLSIMKSDGIIFADDYGNKGSVKRAIDEFVEKHNLKLEVFSSNQVQIKL